MSTVKCALVGDSCGKSCMIIRCFKNTYRPLFVASTYENHFQRQKEVDGIWRNLFITDYGGSGLILISSEPEVFIVCFSIEKHINSFLNVRKKWIPKVRKESNAPIILVGTKLDVRSEVETILPSQGVEMAQEIGATMYLECSSETGEGVDEVFNSAVRVAVAYKVKQENTKSLCLLQ